MVDETDDTPPPIDDADDAAPHDLVGDSAGDEDVNAALEKSLHTGLSLLQQAAQIAVEYTPFDLEMATLERNDKGNAERLTKRFANQVIWVQGVGWHGWMGGKTHGYFSKDHGPMIAGRTVDEVQRAIFGETKALLERGRWLHETPQAFEKRIGAHYSWAVASGNAQRGRAMLEKAMPYVTKLPSELDTNKLLFNCANGVLDLSEPDHVRLRRARREDFITRQSPARYDEKADCPKFKAFLEKIMPDADVRAFIQRWFGYCMTGDISEQSLTLWWGQGANGKSVLAGVLQYMLHDYAKTVNFASLLRNDRRSGGEASPDIARLRGARAAVASEPENQVQFSEGLIKQLTGEDTITARHLNQEFFEYIPQFKISALFNNKPTVKGTDDGIWRRLLLIPFEVTIPKPERDKKLLDKLKAEAPGILNWMIEGYRAWRAMGLSAPKAVIAATEEYRAESDLIAEFMLAALEDSPHAEHFVESGVMYNVYLNWCRANGVTAFSQTTFGKRIVKKYHRDRDTSSGRMIYTGVSLKPGFELRHKPAAGADDPPPHDGGSDDELR